MKTITTKEPYIMVYDTDDGPETKGFATKDAAEDGLEDFWERNAPDRLRREYLECAVELSYGDSDRREESRQLLDDLRWKDFEEDGNVFTEDFVRCCPDRDTVRCAMLVRLEKAEEEDGAQGQAGLSGKGKRDGCGMIWFDMDGVLAKWDTHASYEDTLKPGYFLDREAEKSAVGAVQALIRRNIPVGILSAVYQNGYAEKEKAEWLYRHGLGDIPHLFVPYGEKKASYILDPHALLVDDYTVNLRAWQEDGMTAVKFYNGINGRHGTWHGAFVTAQMDAQEIADRICFCMGQEP